MKKDNFCLINIKNCNNIASGNIKLTKGKLNIKYASNGTGKSTISKALEAFIENNEDKKNALIPFKYLGEANAMKPEILGIEDFNSIAVFNEKYVENYIFQPNELIENSFEIFIKTDNYEKHTEEILSLLKDIHSTFETHPELDELMNTFQGFIDGFGKAKSGYSNNSLINKGIGKGNKIDNIPEGLEVYSPYLKSKDNVKWLKWQMDGENYLNMGNKCPYCVNGVRESRKKTILRIKKEYDAKSVEYLTKMLEIFESLNPYFSNRTKEVIEEISQNATNISDVQKDFLIEVKTQVEGLLKQLYELKNINFHSLEYSERIADDLDNYKINLSYYSHLDSDLSSEKINAINSALDNVLLKANLLQDKINEHKQYIKNTINEYSDEINDFLHNAGYNYSVSIEYDNENNYHLVLKHADTKNTISSANEHLSYGERNAFAIVLFMYEVLKKNPDLIILDDPISSFDGNKKFAIINMLFMKKRCLSGRTVLLLTHEFNTVIDSIRNMKRQFDPSPVAAFLTTKQGILTEKKIGQNDIKSFVEIVKSNILSEIDILNKLIYLRRLLEIQEKGSVAYQLISNILHKRQTPLYKYFDKSLGKTKERQMTEDEIARASREIQKFIPNFDYMKEYNKVQNNKILKELYFKSDSNYEKIQLYRIVLNENSNNDVVRKFINEVFHVENDYLFQLDPKEYDTIPQYIIDECDKEMTNMD